MQNSPQPYPLPEGSLLLPLAFEDRSVNNFVYLKNGKPHYNFTVARDTALPSEDIAAYVTRQIALLKRNIPSYQLKQRSPVQLGKDASALFGEQLDACYKSGHQTVYQCHAAFFITHERALNFSASSASAFDADFYTVWQAWLASFVPAA